MLLKCKKVKINQYKTLPEMIVKISPEEFTKCYYDWVVRTGRHPENNNCEWTRFVNYCSRYGVITKCE